MRYKYPFTNMPGPGDPETWGPCTGHPGDPRTVDKTETPEFEDERLLITKERILDIRGYHLESFSEAPDEWAAGLAKLVIQWLDAPSDRLKAIETDIGVLVAVQLTGYCTPTDEDVLEALGGDDE